MEGMPHYPPEPNILGWLNNFILPEDVILDVGSGDRRYQDVGAQKVWSLDSWERGKPDYLVDLRTGDLPTDKEISVVFLLDVLEHMEKGRGREILRQAQDLVTRAVVVMVPLDWDENRDPYEDPEGFYYRNENVLHKSLWFLWDFYPGWTRVWLPSTRKDFFGYWLKR